MKVVSPRQMRIIESSAFHEGASEDDYMEEAGGGVGLVVHDYAEKYGIDRHIVLICGKGNNAGDAYVAGTHLLHLDYDVVAFQVLPLTESSTLCQNKHNRFLAEGGVVVELTSAAELHLPKRGIIIDGIFGTGFHGTVDEPIATIIKMMNDSLLPIIAIDIPSGLNAETGEAIGAVVRAKETAFLGLAKTGFFLKEGWDLAGKLRYIDFGLAQKSIEESEFDMLLLTDEILKPSLPPMRRNRNKYQAGYVVGLAGSEEMPGAAILSSMSALQGGAGIVRLMYPKGTNHFFTAAPVELIRSSYELANVKDLIDQMNKASATFIGPGIGRSKEVVQLLQTVLPKLVKPCVIDADALTIWAQNEQLMVLPEHTIMTPHLGEMKRMLKREDDLTIDMQTLYTCQEFVEKHQVTLVLKGGPTFILHPGEAIRVSAAGDPGMATAGSGDVLTGLLAALLAQGLSPHCAAMLGVFMHGVAGEYAAEDLTSYCMMATDILYRFPDAFRLIES